MATAKFAFAPNQQLQQHYCVFIICFLTFLVCKIWWFSFCSLQSYTLTSLFHYSQAFRGQTYSWIFVCTWGVFLHKIGVFKKRLRKSSGRKYCVLFPADGLFETTFFNFIQACNSAARQVWAWKTEGTFFHNKYDKKASLDSLAWEKCDAPTRLNNFSWALERNCLRSWVAFKRIFYTSKHLTFWVNFNAWKKYQPNFGRLLKIYCFASTRFAKKKCRNFVETCLTKLDENNAQKWFVMVVRNFSLWGNK